VQFSAEINSLMLRAAHREASTPPISFGSRMEQATQCTTISAHGGIAKILLLAATEFGNARRVASFAAMERFYLSIICASAVLLVTAFVATTPKLEADSQVAQLSVLRLVQR
jgi:hypothetical protein